jgi:hypothetical protein
MLRRAILLATLVLCVSAAQAQTAMQIQRIQIPALNPAAQIDQLQKQYLHKRLLEKYGLPRLSLFYM